VHEGVNFRLRALLRQMHRPTPRHTVGEIMTRQVRVASADRPLTELVPVFSEGGHRHLPIIDAERRLVGIVTQSDLIRAMDAAVRG
jgi:CBS domain-containing membrane protein